jgi:hypothetical protein
MGVTIDRFKKAFTKKVSPDLLANRQEKVRVAIKELKTAVDTLTAAGASPDPHKDTLFNLVVRFNNIIKARRAPEDTYENLDAIKDEARAAATLAKQAALNAPETQQGLGKVLADGRLRGVKPGELRTAVRQAMDGDSGDPQYLEKLAAMTGGGQVIDAMIADMGSKVTTDQDKEFIEKAILARYQIAGVEGGRLTNKGLPQLYKVLGMVPESHARNNPKLKNINLTAGDGSGDYSGGKLVLNINRSEHFKKDTQFDFDPEDGANPNWLAKGDPHTQFDSCTLHEMGHAVDDTMNFMDKRAGVASFGGWKRVDVAAIAKLAAANLGFIAAFKDQFSEDVLQLMVEDALKGIPSRSFWIVEKEKKDAAPSRDALLQDRGILAAEQLRLDLANDPVWDEAKKAKAFIGQGNCKPAFTVQRQKDLANEIIDAIVNKEIEMTRAVDAALDRLARVTDPPDEQNYNLLLAHPIFEWCAKARTGDAWKFGASHAKAVAKMDGNAYTCDKSGWFQYDMAVRSKSISKYQFNTPAEWFAELYAAFYLKKLPPAHPDYQWMSTEIHTYAG